MSNIDAVRGFKLVGTRHGRDPIIKECYIASGDGTATFVGDAVKLASAGSDPTGSAPSVAQAAATNPIVGVVLSFNQVKGISAPNLNLYRKHRPASTAMYCQVCVDPSAIYEIQADDVGSTLTASSVGLNADITIAAGDTNTGMSGMELDSSTAATTPTLAFRIVGIVPRPDNEVGVANQKVLVMANLHQYLSDTGTTGV